MTTDAVAADPTPSEPSDPVAAHWSEVAAFVEAVHNGDVDASEGIVAEGSPAAEYVSYIRNSNLAQQAAGFDPHYYDAGYSFDPDEDLQVVDISFRDVTGDGSEPADYTWSDFQVTDAGKLESWTGASGALEEVLGSSHDSKSAKGQVVTVANSYESNGGAVWVVLKVDSTVDALADYAPVYVGPDGVVRQPVAANVTEIVADATSYLSYAYDDAEFGGKFKYMVDYDTPVTLSIS